ncbi:histidine kinase [Alkaliphilus metalliredigens QYMF]|uniref:Histidine kinase n=1 Tax=Alkaliphilus metalliredigens (strain QYMF) TaxID=293826 RepID=A6TQG8_ALKMQ|nr:ATP-binding protein [Alkaliphilus metalliredigens]ABR48436.1 histidine kinase [Alkaliphilus metalliredigens QYMF]
MKELSLHILDIAQNSIAAKAKKIEIHIWEDLENNQLRIKISDDGNGMDAKLAKRAVDPFCTSRNTRRVGMGLPLLKLAANQCNGDLELQSQKGVGTTVEVCFQYDHIDRVPLGNMVDTMLILIGSDDQIDYIYTHYYKNKIFFLDTKEVKKQLGDVPITNVNVVTFLKEYIEEGLKELVKI